MNIRIKDDVQGLSWCVVHRGKILRRARELAASGQHKDCDSIIEHLEAVEGFSDARGHLETIRFYLDGQCLLACR